MLKKNKKEITNCIKCGKHLSKKEIKKGISKCEYCLGKQAKKTKGILSVIGTTVAVFLFFLTKGKKGKL